MQAAQQNSGFTLVGLMVTVAVLAILLTVGLPSFQSTLDKRRLTGTVEQLYADLQYARSAAIRQNKKVTVYFSDYSTTSPWCYGMTDTSNACDCKTAASACTVGDVQKVVPGTDFRNVTLTSSFASDNFAFDPQRGTAKQGTVSVASAGIGTIKVIVSNPGRVRICSDNVADYKPSSGSCP